jgi:phenylacetate-CoA ligase
MDTYGAFYRRVLMPAWEGVVRQRPTMKRWQELEKIQYRPRQEIEQIQLVHLKRLLAHAGDHIPYYRDLFREHGFAPAEITSLRDLALLPFLTKEIIREQYLDLVDERTRATHIHKHTSGSSGQPVFFEYDRNSEVWRQAVKWRGYGWAGYHPGMRSLHYWGMPVGLAGLTGAKARLDRMLRRESYVDCLRQDPKGLARAVGVIRRRRPEVLVGYTLATATLARFIVERGFSDLSPLTVITGAEALLDPDRVVMRSAFQGDVFETYGSRETMLLAAECELHAGLHTMDDAHVVEVVDGDRAAAPGTIGEVVVTDLHNFGMPLIRYKNGDLARTMDDTPCPCGRGLGRIARITGRQIDTLHDAHGMPVPGMMVCAVIASLKHQIREFQVIQRARGDVVVRIVRGAKFEERAMDGVLERIQSYLRGCAIRVEWMASIDRGPTGKHRPVIVE